MVSKMPILPAQPLQLERLSPAITRSRWKTNAHALWAAALMSMASGCSGAPDVKKDKPAAEPLPPVEKTTEKLKRPLDEAVVPPTTSKPAPAPATALASPTGSDGMTGDGSAIHLGPLSSADVKLAKLTGEIGCSFSTAGNPPLLVVMGNVSSTDFANGVVKIMDSVELVMAGSPGGFDAILKGGIFAGKGKVIEVALAGAKQVGNGESPAFPATLTIDRADGARRTIAGLWSCGP